MTCDKARMTEIINAELDTTMDDTKVVWNAKERQKQRRQNLTKRMIILLSPPAIWIQHQMARTLIWLRSLSKR